MKSQEVNKGIQSYLILARNMSIATIFIIGYNVYEWGLSYLSLIFLVVFIIYSFIINKGNLLISITGLATSILFSISYLAITNDMLAIIVVMTVNYGFINGVIGSYKIHKTKSAQANAYKVTAVDLRFAAPPQTQTLCVEKTLVTFKESWQH